MRLEIVDEALNEAAAAHEHYLAIRSELGREFGAELQRGIGQVVERPLAWSGSRDLHAAIC